MFISGRLCGSELCSHAFYIVRHRNCNYVYVTEHDQVAFDFWRQFDVQLIIRWANKNAIEVISECLLVGQESSRKVCVQLKLIFG